MKTGFIGYDQEASDTSALTFYPLPRGEEMAIGRFWFCGLPFGKSSRAIYTNFSLRLHYFGEAGKEGDAEAIPFEPA
jgi:hypothetical protein